MRQALLFGIFIYLDILTAFTFNFLILKLEIDMKNATSYIIYLQTTCIFAGAQVLKLNEEKKKITLQQKPKACEVGFNCNY